MLTIDMNLLNPKKKLCILELNAREIIIQTKLSIVDAHYNVFEFLNKQKDDQSVLGNTYDFFLDLGGLFSIVDIDHRVLGP